VSALHDLRVADGSLLDIASGVESVMRRFDALVERYAQPTEVSGQEGDRKTTELLLGLIAIRSRLEARFERSNQSYPQPPIDRSSPGSWLR